MQVRRDSMMTGALIMGLVGLLILSLGPTMVNPPSRAVTPRVALPASGASPIEPGTAGRGTAGLAPTVSYDGPIPTYLPPAWEGRAMPPGAPAPLVLGANGPYHYANGACYGRWPASGQSGYAHDCYGHDEPAINPFSDLPGSGGNVSWNVSLPVDASPTHNQSDLYAAIWFGMNLFDPVGYDGQCFLELQMYPDTAPSGAPAYGVWSAFAVAWQIDLANGQENPCYAAPLTDLAHHHGLRMTGGDHLYVNMTGWQGSPYGENITVVDVNNGAQSFLNLYNHRFGYPLDPAFVANNVDDALPWSPGGDLPVSFAFESGHTYKDPANNTFGGCNAGPPPPTPLNPATPCGSYSPRAWAADTRTPWHFYPVSFFNAHQRVVAAQYGFEQDFGAAAWIDGLSNGACTGRDGSAFCSYPWYSYSAPAGAFEFGATDYTGTTENFGDYNEYDPSLQVGADALPFFPVRNFSLPTAAGSSLTIIVVGHGMVHFLDRAITATTTFHHLAPGAYSVSSNGISGSTYRSYATTGGLHLDAAATGWNSFDLSGNATLTARFGPTAPSGVAVAYTAVGATASITAVPGFTFALSAYYPSAGPGFFDVPVFASHATTLASGSTHALVPGIYSFQADPPPGYNFTGWTTSGGVYLFTPQTNFTLVNVTGAGTIWAHYAPTPYHATIWLAAYPAQGGSIEFGPFTFASGAVFQARAGTYPLVAHPAPGYTFVGWSAGFVATISNFSARTSVLIQRGDDWITAAFAASPTVTVGHGGAGGGFALNGIEVHGSVQLAQVGNLTYTLDATPNTGMRFTGWSVSATGAAWIANRSAPLTSVQVNGSVTITAHYVRASLGPFTLTLTATQGGALAFNVVDATQGSLALGVSRGLYDLTESPAPGYTFVGWSTTGAVTVGTSYVFVQPTFADIGNLAGVWQPVYNVTVSGAGTVTAHFAGSVHPVTFIDFPFDAQRIATLTGAAGTFTVSAGRTVWLPDGVYNLTFSGAGISGLAWFATTNLSVTGAHLRHATITVDGSGTIYLTGGFWGATLAGSVARAATSVGEALPTPSGPTGSARWA